MWSETLGQCFSPSYLPIVCLAGRCGQILSGSPHACLDSCAKREWCSTCLKSSNCGWCAEKGTSGRGQCLQGGLQGYCRIMHQLVVLVVLFVCFLMYLYLLTSFSGMISLLTDKGALYPFHCVSVPNFWSTVKLTRAVFKSLSKVIT